MASRVFLHIGAPKSGTTYLQTLLWANQDRLRDAGVLLPGSRSLDHNDVSSWTRLVRPTRQHKETTDRLMDEIHAWPGSVILSCEWFVMADEGQIRRLLARLEAPELSVVFTARDLASATPAAWQESLKLGLGRPLDSFVADLGTATNPRWCWQTLDPAVALVPWCDEVGPENVSVVTVPRSRQEPDLLWRRFCRACGLEGIRFDTENASTNQSVGVESARFLELLGPNLREALRVERSRWFVPYRWIRELVAHDLLVPRGGHKIALSEGDHRALYERSLATKEHLATMDVNVVGDLDDLTPGERSPDALSPDEVPTQDVLQIALDVIPELLGRLRDETERSDRARRRVRELEDEVDRLRTHLERAESRLSSSKESAEPPSNFQVAVRRARAVGRRLRGSQ